VAEVRVYHLAQEFGVDSKTVMGELAAMGEFVRSASSSLEAPVVRRLRQRLAAQPGRQAVPSVSIKDIGTEEEFLAAINETVKYFDDGDLVAGTVIEVDRDKVLVDIGYKIVGVIPSSELPDEDDVNARDVVKCGKRIEAYVLQKEDMHGRLILSMKRARYEPVQNAVDGIGDEDGVGRGRRDAPPERPSAPVSEAPDLDSMRELLESWDALRKLVPEDQDSVSFLASRSGLRRDIIFQVRRTRNQCAHPDGGWPAPYDIDMAVATARELLRRLQLPSRTQRRP
jgi:predicted RNA-binding protein with RPS1 domain